MNEARREPIKCTCKVNGEHCYLCLYGEEAARELDALAARVQELERELEQVRVQLAGCLAAAEGATTDVAKQGDYGWSPAYQETLDLRRQYDRAMKMMREVRPMLLGLAAAKHAGAFSAECPVCLINQVVELDPPHVDAGRRP